MMNFKKKKISQLFVVGAFLVPAVSHSAPVLEELIVTAQKREQSLQDVPISVAAVSGEQLEKSGIEQLQYLEQVNSSFVLSNNGGYSLPFIRGVGSQLQGNAIYSSVAIYIDDVYQARLGAGLQELGDIEQIQVLKGPQGALYGRNATGGAVVITTKTPEPGDSFEGKVSVNLGNANKRNVELNLAGSIGERSAANLYIANRERDGFINNLSDASYDLNDKDALAIKGKWVFDATDDVRLEVGFLRNEFEGRGGLGDFQHNPVGAAQTIGGTAAGFITGDLACASVGCQQLFGGIAGLVAANLATTDPRNVRDALVSGFQTGAIPAPETDGPTSGSFTNSEFTQAHFKVSLESFDGFDLKSITSWGSQRRDSSRDVFAVGETDLSPLGIPLTLSGFGFSGDNDSDAYSQEFQFVAKPDADFQWIAGAQYFVEDGGVNITVDLLGLANARNSFNEFENESVSAYAQGTYPVSESFNLTVGVRYTDETYEVNDFVSPLDPNNILGVPATGFTQQEADQINYTLIADYQTDWGMIYASHGTGFKSGSLNTANLLAAPTDPEEITSFELGFKSTLREGAVNFNGSVFHYDYENIHFNVVNSNSGATFLVDGSEAGIIGADIEVRAALTENLRLESTMTYLDHEYNGDTVNPTNGTALLIDGNGLAGAADFAATVSLIYDVDTSLGTLSLFGSASYSSGHYFDAENIIGTGGLNDDAYTVANLSATLSTSDERFDLQLWSNNIFDEKYNAGGLVVSGGASQITNQAFPRTYGVSVGYNF